MAGDTESNIMLKEDDYMFVRTVPEWMSYQTVTIHGEVKFTGTYAIKKERGFLRLSREQEAILTGHI
ncbi:MAG: hypothetical protein L0956_09800, partial [Candidatus Mariimomonas ferrooxydans]